MSGLLDKKSRIIDFVITDAGKSELTKGELKVKYASFSDSQMIYEQSPDYDHTFLLALEATTLPSDTTVIDLDNNGLVLSTRMSSSVDRNISQINERGILTTSSFYAFTNNAFKSIDNQFLIRDVQRFVNNDEFTISPLTMSFQIDDNSPIALNEQQTKNINALPNIFQDDDFKTQKNFKFLPPVHINGGSVFDFDDITARDFPKTSEEVVSKLHDNIVSNKITFDETSENNNLLIQFFEIANGEGGSKELRKLKIVKHFSNNINETDDIYFIGKTITDSRDIETFVKLFTLAISK